MCHLSLRFCFHERAGIVSSKAMRNSTIVLHIYIYISHNTRYIYKHPIHFCKLTCNRSVIVKCTSTGDFVSLIPSHLLHLSLRGIVLQRVYPGTGGSMGQTCRLTYPTFGKGYMFQATTHNNPWFTFPSPSAPFLLGLFKAKSGQGHIGYFRLWEACDTWHLDMKDNGLGRRKWQWKIYENVQASRKRLSVSATKCGSVVFCQAPLLITHKQPISVLRNALGKKLDVHLSGV